MPDAADDHPVSEDLAAIHVTLGHAWEHLLAAQRADFAPSRQRHMARFADAIRAVQMQAQALYARCDVNEQTKGEPHE